MRILLVSAHGADEAFGGAERYVRELALGLSARGAEPVVLAAFPPRRNDAGLETIVLHSTDWREDRVRRLKNHVGDVTAFVGRRVTETIETVAPDLVHTSNLPGFSTAVWEAARRAGVPVAHTLHDYHLLCPRTSLLRRDGSPCRPHPLLCGLRTRRLARWAPAVSQVVAGSEHLLRRHAGFFPAASEHVIRLPLTPVAPTPLPPPADEPRSVGFLGTLGPNKGVRALLAAAPVLAREGITVRIAGDGPLRAEVEAAAAGGTVVYDGLVSDAGKLRFLAECDVGLVPSLWDEPSGPPYVVCEWIAAGRPVLATPRGGLREAIETLGGVCPVEPTPEGIAAAVADLRREDRWREVVATLPRIEDDRDLDRWLDEHERVHRAALGAPAVAGARA
jgi:glycosyltransferase involved in cell wall biosynthesis